MHFFRRSKLRRLAVLLPVTVHVATGELGWTNSILLGWLAGRLAEQSEKRQSVASMHADYHSAYRKRGAKCVVATLLCLARVMLDELIGRLATVNKLGGY